MTMFARNARDLILARSALKKEGRTRTKLDYLPKLQQKRHWIRGVKLRVQFPLTYRLFLLQVKFAQNVLKSSTFLLEFHAGLISENAWSQCARNLVSNYS